MSPNKAPLELLDGFALSESLKVLAGTVICAHKVTTE